MSFFLPRAVAWSAALLPALAMAAGLTLDEALQLAAQRSESARAAQAGVSSALQSSRAAGQLPDPVLRAGVDNLPLSGSDRFTTRDFMTMKRIGIAQEWLSSEKRSARQAAADALVAREQAQTRMALGETRLQTALAYIDAFHAGESFKLATLMEHHAHEEREAARARLASATSNSQDLLALTAAVGLAEDEAAEARQQQGSAMVTLQRWIGRSADDLAPPQPFAPPSEDSYVARHPGVVAAQRDVVLARQAVAVATSERKPNWTWEVSYGQRSGNPDLLSLAVSIPLQLARDQRQDREIAAKQALVDQAEAVLAEARRAAAGEFRALANDVQRLQQRIDRYHAGVLTPAAQRTSAATAGYAANQVTLVSLFEARRAEVDARRKLLILRRDLARARAQLVLKPLAAGDVP